MKKLNTAGLERRVARAKQNIDEEQMKVEKTALVPLDLIDFNEDNIFNQFDSDDNIEELAKNIEDNGLLHNIVVVEKEDGRYLLISGERRTKAFKFLNRQSIRANIIAPQKPLDIAKKMFFANTEIRQYTLEEKLKIIKDYGELVLKYDDGENKEAVEQFREAIAQAFGVSERQAIKLITISEELCPELTDLLCNEKMDINTAAILAQLPLECQMQAIEIFNGVDGDDPVSKRYAKDLALRYAQQAKNIMSKNRTQRSRFKASNIYHEQKLAQVEEELQSVEKEISENGATEELIKRKEELEAQVENHQTHLSGVTNEQAILAQKEIAEIKKIYESNFFKAESGPSEKDKDKTGKIAQQNKITKEVKNMENTLNKLLDMFPSEELTAIAVQLEAYKKRLAKK